MASYESRRGASDRAVPEIAHLLDDPPLEAEADVVDVGTHTVAVTHLSDGFGKPEQKNPAPSVMTKTEQRTLNRLVVKEVQKTKAFRAQQQIRSVKDAKKSGKKAKPKKKTLKKREKHYNPMKK